MNQLKESDYVIVKVGETSSRHSRWDIHLKNLFWSKDHSSTAGSFLLNNFKASQDSRVLRNLLRYGFKLQTINTLDEFGNGSSNESSLFGSTKNGVTLGGSSGGTAWAAHEMGGLGVGTDTGGSVRDVTYSLKGLIGLKPTWGLISRIGLIDYCNPFDTVGFLSTNPTTLKLALCVNLREEGKMLQLLDTPLRHVDSSSLKVDLNELQESYFYWTSIYFYSNMQRFKLLDFSDLRWGKGNLPSIRKEPLNDLTLANTLAAAPKFKYLLGWINLLRGREKSLLHFSQVRVRLRRMMDQTLGDSGVIEVPLRINKRKLDRNVWIWLANLCKLPSISYEDRCFIGSRGSDLSLIKFVERKFKLS